MLPKASISFIHILSIVAMLFLFSFEIAAQDDHKPLIKGNQSYQEGNFVEAEEEYLRAIEAVPNSVKGHYNRGNAIYKGIQGDEEPEVLKQRLNKAAESYLYAIENADDQLTKSQAYHNLGNTYMGQQELKKGVEAYKNALRLNPNDMDTKTNLQYALRQMQQQQQQQQNGEGEGEGEESESQDGQESETPPQDGDQQQPPSEGEQEQDPKDQQDGGQSQQGKNEEQPTPEEMTKEEVLRQLKVMDNEEKKVQEKLKKEQRNEYTSDKDW